MASTEYRISNSVHVTEFIVFFILKKYQRIMPKNMFNYKKQYSKCRT